MATADETEEALLNAIQRVAEAALGERVTAAYAADLGSAAKAFAEARAWLRSPGQPH